MSSVFLENLYDGPDILNVGQQTRRGRMHVIIIGANGRLHIDIAAAESDPPVTFCCARTSDAAPIPISSVATTAFETFVFRFFTTRPVLGT